MAETALPPAAERFVAEGRAESPLHDHAETVAVISVLERARQRLGGDISPQGAP